MDDEALWAIATFSARANGRAHALHVAVSAVIATLAQSLPPLVEQLEGHLDALSDFSRPSAEGGDEVGQASLSAYDQELAELRRLIAVLRTGTP